MSGCFPGSANPNSKFSDSDILEIRAQWVTGLLSGKEIADKWGVCTTTIYSICRGESYPQDGYSHVGIKDRFTIKGERHPAHKLTEPDVLKIRKMLSEGVTQKRIAELFGVAQCTVSEIKLYKKWRHLP